MSAHTRCDVPGMNMTSVSRSGRRREEPSILLPVTPFTLLVENVSTLVRSPLRYVAALSLALRTSRSGLRGLALQIAYFQEAVLLASKMRSDGIKHLHNHFGDNGGTVALLAGVLARISYSITFHGPHIFFDPTHWALREKVRQASFIRVYQPLLPQSNDVVFRRR